MASRAAWKGVLSLGGIFSVRLEAFKATDKYAGDDPLKIVCECHHEPFKRTEVCATSGALRQTEALVKEGKTGAKAVKAVEKPDGTFAALPAGVIESITAAVESKEMVLLALEPRGDVPWHTGEDFYRLTAQKDATQNEKDAVDALARMLFDDEQAIIVTWTVRGRQKIAAITLTAKQDALTMTVLRHAAEVREPEERAKAVAYAEVDPKAIELMRGILGELPDHADYPNLQDDAVTRKQVAVQAALAGQPVATTEVQAEQPQEQAGNMIALLEGIRDTQAKPKAKAKK